MYGRFAWLFVALFSFLPVATLSCGESMSAVYSDGGDTETNTDTDTDQGPPGTHYESGHIEVEPYAYTLDGEDLTTCEARIFFSFHPSTAIEGDGLEPQPQRPIMVLFNGGPGAASEMLFSLNTAANTLDSTYTGDQKWVPNPVSEPWLERFNLLYIDARQTGFSYDVVQDPSSQEARQAQFSYANFNIYTDAADVIRALLRFVEERPVLLDHPRFVIVGESYGGTRATVMLHILLHHQFYGDGSLEFTDPALTEEISDFYAAALGQSQPGEVDPSDAATIFGDQVLIQPVVTAWEQFYESGLALEESGSPLWDLMDETGEPFEPCDGDGCDSQANAIEYVQGVGRDEYCLDRPQGWLWNHTMEATGHFLELSVLEAMTAVDPATIEFLFSDQRQGAFRMAGEEEISEGDLTELYGQTQPWDGHFLPYNMDVGEAFYSAGTAGPGSSSIGPMFIQNTLWVRTFITRAEEDVKVYTPGIPRALAEHFPSLVEDVIVGDGFFEIHYVAGAFGDDAPQSATVAFPMYEDGCHTVSQSNPDKLAADVTQWLLDPSSL